MPTLPTLYVLGKLDPRGNYKRKTTQHIDRDSGRISKFVQSDYPERYS